MAGQSPRRTRLAIKVNLILVVTLAVGVGLILAAFAANLIASRDQITRRFLKQEANDLYTSIENFMIPGEAPLAVKFFAQVQAVNPGSRILLFRQNGNFAFSDNTTISRVNTNLGTAKFRPREGIVTTVSMPSKPGFAQAAATPPAERFFREDEGGRSYFRAYRPLINLPKCTVCHGSDHTVRGVIDIRSDITDEARGQTIILAGAGAGFFLVVSLLAFVIGAFLRRVVIGPVNTIGLVCSGVAAGRFEGRVATRSDDEIGDLARTVNTMVEGLEERFKLTKYVSAGTLGALRAGEEPKRVTRTLLFTDVRGFTSYTEGHPPERVVEVLNALLDSQARIIHENGGDIDKFVGDEIVSYFQDEDASLRACRSAVAIARFCAGHGVESDGLSVGMGIASGSVILGMVGSARRADYTVIGDAVNVASRLCSLAKAGQVVVDSGAKSEAGPGLSFKGPFGAKLKGKEKPREVWILLTSTDDDAQGNFKGGKP